MKTRNLLQAAAIASLLAAGVAAQAAPVGDSDTLQSQAVQVQSNRSFAANQAASLAGSSRVALQNSGEGYGSTVPAVRSSGADRAAVRQAAMQAERSGAIERGDALTF
ncbi:hypothetical protein GT347_16270 [Xylophilus rhododendri]|uniref:DUF4148 domain-containing protein n=1 Tax=Xylophilus rhododendri TaxID=2697032 RepID=A0A857J6F1_9BURK|nr:hypothetical protein [Xylophilus rhododendri]QHI99396.1 hypothetical protein GT347_16270 [Xylophilus rhododendri]